MTDNLRPARPLDAGALGAMLTEAVSAHSWKPRLHSATEDIGHVGRMIDRGWITVASDAENRPLGFLARDGNYVHALYVAGTARSSGVGQRLMTQAKGARDRLELWTFEANLAAHRFYERQGFDIVERTDGRTNEERLPDIRYVWEKPALVPAQDITDQSKETQP